MGTTFLDEINETLVRGSPPRAWGQRARTHSPPLQPRFTPTGVGTTPPPHPPTQRGRFTPTGVGTTVHLLFLAPPLAVHPHGRGDNVRLALHPVEERGSPPRAWGQHCAIPSRRRLQRFTPTGVGTTRSNTYARFWQHGSPPRAWGQRVLGGRQGRSERFTPTGVGTTITTVNYPQRKYGSPPRAWGQHRKRFVGS